MKKLFVPILALCLINSSQAGDIVDVAAGNKSFRTLVAAVKAAGLVETLKSKGPFTVFAPTDEAFSKLPKGTVESLLKPENKKKLVSILTYHVLPGKVQAKDVKSGRVKTVNGSSVELRVYRGAVTVDKAKVVATDVMASNGVIHVIDRVIIPPSSGSHGRSSQSRSTSRGYLGVSIEPSSRPRGVRIQRVYPNTGAAKAHLKTGDVIQKINGASLTNSSSLISRLSETKAGQKVTLLVFREGKSGTVQVQLGGSYSSRSSTQKSQQENADSKQNNKNSRERDWEELKDWVETGVENGRINRKQANEIYEDFRKSIEESKREEEKKDWGQRDRDDDRRDQMRKEWEEQVKRWREMRERNDDDDDRKDWRHQDDSDKQRKMEEWQQEREERSEAIRRAVGAWIERMREAREHSRDDWDDRDRKDWGRHERDEDRGEQMRKEWEEGMKRWREMRERDGDDRDKEDWDRRGRDEDRGEQIRKEWEERMKRWREMRNRGSWSRR